MHIALIEGNYQTARLIQLMLQFEHHIVDSFAFAELLCDSKQSFDCIIANPGYPHYACKNISLLKNSYPLIPRIYISLFNEIPNRVRKIDMDSPVLMMPFHRKKLIEVLSSLSLNVQGNKGNTACHEL